MHSSATRSLMPISLSRLLKVRLKSCKQNGGMSGPNSLRIARTSLAVNFEKPAMLVLPKVVVKT